MSAPSQTAVAIGRNIAAARGALGISRPELGRRAGVSGQAVWSWEHAEREIGAANLLALACALHVSVMVLYGDGAEPAEPYAAAYEAGWNACAAVVAKAVKRGAGPG